MFQKILVALDGSRNAEQVLPWVNCLAASSGTPAVLAWVLPKVYPLKGMPFAEREPEAEEYLAQVQKLLLQNGISSEILLPAGSPAECLVQTAQEEHCGLIVLKTRGGAKIARWLIGGVTERVVRLSSVPVLIVRGQGSTRPNPKRILVPLDGSAGAKRVLAWAKRWARFFRAPLQLLHVRPVRVGRRGKSSSSPGQPGPPLEHWCHLLKRRGVAASYRLGAGDPAREILRNSRASDLIVMTTHGYGGLKHWVRGSVAEKVIQESPAPVFVFKGRLPRAARSSTRRTRREKSTKARKPE